MHLFTTWNKTHFLTQYKLLIISVECNLILIFVVFFFCLKKIYNYYLLLLIVVKTSSTIKLFNKFVINLTMVWQTIIQPLDSSQKDLVTFNYMNEYNKIKLKQTETDTWYLIWWMRFCLCEMWFTHIYKYKVLIKKNLNNDAIWKKTMLIILMLLFGNIYKPLIFIKVL